MAERMRLLTAVAMVLIAGCGQAVGGDDLGMERESRGTDTASSRGDAFEDQEGPADVRSEVPSARGNPCLRVEPGALEFGPNLLDVPATALLSLSTCSDAIVRIESIRLAEASAKEFSLPLTALGGTKPTPEEPLEVAPGQVAIVDVGFVADKTCKLDELGEPIPESGRILIEADGIYPVVEVDLSGYGVTAFCPTAVAKCLEGNEVLAGTMLHLFGGDSIPGTGVVESWQWSVEAPDGSQSFFVPSSAYPNPTFWVDVAGTYTFSLTVSDSGDPVGCDGASLELEVVSDAALRIELEWLSGGISPVPTPDPEPDVDLHFLHPIASGWDGDGDGHPDGWFDIPYDCFWYNPNPEWGSWDPAVQDDPLLYPYDIDGAVPEFLRLFEPEPGVYTVGVHYYSDWGLGPTAAAVRIYIDSYLAASFEQQVLHDSDMWWVATVEWPTGKIEPFITAAGEPKIVPDYDCPFL